MTVSKKIKTFSTHEFMDRFFVPESELQVMKRPEYGIFFSMEVQELIKLSKLPVPPSRSTTHILIYPVSYTHLDVYKRQQHKSPSQK